MEGGEQRNYEVRKRGMATVWERDFARTLATNKIRYWLTFDY